MNPEQWLLPITALQHWTPATCHLLDSVTHILTATLGARTVILFVQVGAEVGKSPAT